MSDPPGGENIHFCSYLSEVFCMQQTEIANPTKKFYIELLVLFQNLQLTRKFEPLLVVPVLQLWTYLFPSELAIVGPIYCISRMLKDSVIILPYVGKNAVNTTNRCPCTDVKWFTVTLVIILNTK